MFSLLPVTSSGLLYSVDTSTLTIPVLAKQSIMLRKRTSVKNLKVKAINVDYITGNESKVHFKATEFKSRILFRIVVQHRSPYSRSTRGY